MMNETPPAWQLPPGVNASLWQYAHSERLAAEEDDYFAGHPLFHNDAYWVDERFTPPGRLVDLGCGVGRHAIRLAQLGFDVVAVELSRPMLETVARKAAAASVEVACVEANLCKLDCFPNNTFDFALSMFSTLGMIRGREERQTALDEAARILKPGGRLALHVHNLFLNLRIKNARGWLVHQLIKTLLKHPDAGDRRMTYRGIPNMEVHLYRWGELKRSLDRAGLVIDEVLAIHEHNAEPIRFPGFLPSIRAGGWMVFARKP
jgi:SAM-dependent methyltransferase